MPDAEKVWRAAAVASESADGSSYSVVAADGNGEVEVTMFRMVRGSFAEEGSFCFSLSCSCYFHFISCVFHFAFLAFICICFFSCACVCVLCLYLYVIVSVVHSFTVPFLLFFRPSGMCDTVYKKN